MAIIILFYAIKKVICRLFTNQKRSLKSSLLYITWNQNQIVIYRMFVNVETAESIVIKEENNIRVNLD